MTATVRVFYFDSVMSAPVNSGAGRYTTDSVAILKYPYINRTSVTVDTSAAGTVSVAQSGAKLALIQVQSGKSVHVECNPPNRSTSADTDSPIIRGDVMFSVGSDWFFSFREVA